MKVQIGDRSIWVNYHHLYCFYVIAKEGSISKASQALSIGPSALSIQIKQFEDSLGTKVFDRTHRKLSLNESGRHLFSYAKEIFRLGAEMIEVIYDKPAHGRVHLQVGAIDSIPKHLTLQIVQAAMSVGRCSLSVVEGKGSELLTHLSQHRIDLLLTNFLPSGQPGTFAHRRIARLPLWIVGDRSFRKLRHGYPKSLRGQPFIMPTSDSSVRQEIDSFCRRHQIEPDVTVEAQDVMIQKLLALNGLGITVVPRFAIREYLDAKRLYLIGQLDDAYEELHLISASRRIENPIASRLMRTFKVR